MLSGLRGGRVVDLVRIGGRLDPGLAPRVALAFATFLVSLALVGGVLVYAAYQGRAMRVAERTPTTAAAGEQSKFLWVAIPFTVDHHQAWAYVVRPTDPAAPPPPGVAAWPERGSSVLSPRLAELIERGESSSLDLGRAVGTVGDAGLATPHDLTAYINPTQDDLPTANDEMVAAVEFGDDAAVGFGDDTGYMSTTDTVAIGLFYVPYVLLIVAPAVLVLIAALLVANGPRARRHRQLVFLGSTLWDRMLLQVNSRVVPVMIGLVAAGLAVAAVLSFDISVPGSATRMTPPYVVQAVDARRVWPLLVLAPVMASITALPLALLWRPQTRKGERRTAIWRNRVLGVICAALLVFLVPLVSVLGRLPATMDTSNLVLYVGLAVMMITMPALLAVLLAVIVEWLRRRGSPAAIVGAGLLAGSRTHVTVFSAALGVVLAFLATTSGYAQLFGAPEQGAAELADVTRGRVVLVSEVLGSARLDPAGAAAASLTAGTDAQVIAIVDRDGESWWYAPPGLVSARSLGGGDCEIGLSVAGLEPLGRQLADMGCPRPLNTWDAAGGRTQLMLVTPNGQLDQADVAKRAATLSAIPPRIEIPGDGWLVGAATRQAQGDWIGWFGAVGLGLLLPGLWLISAGDLGQAARRSAGFTVLGMRQRSLAAALAWRIGVPTAIAVFAAGCYTVQLFRWVDISLAGSGAPLETNAVTTYALLALGLTAICWLISVGGSRRAMINWRPGKARE